MKTSERRKRQIKNRYDKRANRRAYLAEMDRWKRIGDSLSKAVLEYGTPTEPWHHEYKKEPIGAVKDKELRTPVRKKKPPRPRCAFLYRTGTILSKYGKYWKVTRPTFRDVWPFDGAKWTKIPIEEYVKLRDEYSANLVYNQQKEYRK